MNEKFFDLPRVKQDKMINGAIEVFAKNGFKHASTDDMVKAVGVSKGLWFHYFGSKLGIYTFAYEYCAKYMFLELSAVVDEKECNFFEVIRQIELAKARAGKSYPYIVMFLDKALSESNEELIAVINETGEPLNDKIASLIRNSDIKNNMDKSGREKIKKMVLHSIQGLLYEKNVSGADIDTIYREIKAYIDIFEQMAINTSETHNKEPMTISVS